MYAVIESGGKQYRVEEGDVLRLDKLDAAVGNKVSFDRVLMLGEGEAIKLAADAAKTSVTAEVVEQGKGRKIVVFKKHRRKNYVRTQGHRQSFTAVRIVKIGEAKAAAKTTAKTEVKAAETKAKAAAAPKKDAVTAKKAPAATKTAAPKKATAAKTAAPKKAAKAPASKSAKPSAGKKE